MPNRRSAGAPGRGPLRASGSERASPVGASGLPGALRELGWEVPRNFLGLDEQASDFARARAGVGPDPVGMHDAGHRVAELHLVIAHGVAAEDGAARLNHRLGAAPEDLFQIPEVALGRVGQDGERGERARAHGVDIGQGVGGGDAAKCERVIDNGREEIHGLHEGALRAQPVDACVVAGVETDQHVRIRKARDARQNRVQNLWTQLGRSTRGLDMSGKLFH